jgi:hypothetical protein
MARPSKYKPEYAELAMNYCLLGATDAEVAAFLGIGLRTVADWKIAHTDFAEAMSTGKDKADAKVVGALYKNATGGNVTAQIFWLKNRRKEDWRDKVDHSLTGPDGGPVQFQSVTRKVIDPRDPGEPEPKPQ